MSQQYEKNLRIFQYSGRWVKGSSRQLQALLTTASFLLGFEFLFYFTSCDGGSLPVTCGMISASITCLFVCVISVVVLGIIMESLEDDQAYLLKGLFGVSFDTFFSVSFLFFVVGTWVLGGSFVAFAINNNRWWEVTFFVIALVLYFLTLLVSFYFYLKGKSTMTFVQSYLDGPPSSEIKENV